MVIEGSPEQLPAEGQGQLQEEGQEQLPQVSPETEAATPEPEAVTSEGEAAKEAQPRTYTQVELDTEKAKVQSGRDKEVNEYKSRLAEMEKSSQQERQAFDYQSLVVRQQRELTDEGDTPQIRSKHQAELENMQARTWYQQNAPRLAEAEKHQVAYQLSEETGVPMKSLLEAKTPDEMKSKAEYLKENVDLKTRLEVLEKQVQSQAPAQAFENAPTSPVGLTGSAKIIAAYAAGDPNVPREQYEKAVKQLYGG